MKAGSKGGSVGGKPSSPLGEPDPALHAVGTKRLVAIAAVRDLDGLLVVLTLARLPGVRSELARTPGLTPS